MVRMTSTISINQTTRLGECGSVKRGRKTQLYVPFFLMGTCGDDKGVIGFSKANPFLPMPKKMDRNWFGTIAKHVNTHPYLDWDTESFRRNVLVPNKERIRADCKITDDEILERVIDDCGVLINCFYRYEDDDDWREECGLEKGEKFGNDGEVGFPPNKKYFFTEKRLEY